MLCLQLVIPKYHGAKLADVPDDQLSEILVRIRERVRYIAPC